MIGASQHRRRGHARTLSPDDTIHERRIGAFLGGGVPGKTLSEDDAATALSQPDNACRADETHQCIEGTLHSGAMHRGAGGDWPGCSAWR